MIKKAFLKITLKSDLCAGSGFAFAGVIDSDVQYDRYGIPCISGRSLKGCLRESAEKLLGLEENQLNQLFGIGGNDSLTGIIIGNAYPEQAQQLRKEIDTLDDLYRPYASPQNILSYYTNVIAQTSIDEATGSAKENTLRFTRVVNHYVDEAEMVFLAPAEFDDTWEDILTKAAKATRHIGSKRNRGMGNVSVILEPFANKQRKIENFSTNQDKRQRISFCVKNTAPLVLSQTADSRSESYIGGNTVLGALAGRYLSIPGNSAEKEAFKDLFLSEKSQYSNLTPAKLTSEGWVVSEPVPLYIKRRKKTRDYVNTLKQNEYNAALTDEERKKNSGNQPKKLLNHWLFRDENGQPIKITEVEKDIVYHHAKHKENSKGQEGLLYYLETIAPGQVFAGDIIVDGRYAELILQLLQMGDFHFGKSRTAQYGACELIDIKIVDDLISDDIYEENEQIVITFLSDAMFTDELGNDTVNNEQIKRIVAEELDIPYGETEEAINDSEDTMITEKVVSHSPNDFLMTKVMAGYNAKWNLQKQQRMGLRAGSSLGFTIEEDMIIEEKPIGENRREGFGKIRVDRISNMIYFIDSIKDDTERKEAASEPNAVKTILKTAILDVFYKTLLRTYFKESNEGKIKITPSALGRLNLMLTEVLNENRNSKTRLDALNERIDSFKNPEKVEAIKEYVGSIMGLDKKAVVEHFIEKTLPKKRKNADEETNIFVVLKNLIGDDEARQEIFDLWPQYLSVALTCQKYQMKEA